ncbi:uncharacterized protein LOC133792557 [Humulus lupulus]|uniref:uncharacterized protein LOC133792557 n=1 Tax=Humulus lupulus TaxID=3486 RepID=UPI002B40ABB4|nr:uncharacterized protein LOC133792557 [Humulus lupulus]
MSLRRSTHNNANALSVALETYEAPPVRRRGRRATNAATKERAPPPSVDNTAEIARATADSNSASTSVATKPSVDGSSTPSNHLCTTSTLPLASPISILNYQFGFELRERRILRLKLQQGYRQCSCCNQSGDCSIKGGAWAGRGSAEKVAELGSGLAGGRRRREGFRLGWAGLGLGRQCREGLSRDGGWAGLGAGWWGSQLHGGDTIARGGSKYLFYFLIFLC